MSTLVSSRFIPLPQQIFYENENGITLKLNGSGDSNAIAERIHNQTLFSAASSGTGENTTISRLPLRESAAAISYRLPSDFNKAEGYILAVRESGISIGADSENAAFYAEQTLAQLIYAMLTEDGGSADSSVPVGVAIPACTIIDSPRLAMRGFQLCWHMVDEHSPMLGPNFDTTVSFLKQRAHLKLNTALLELDALFPYKKHPRISNRLSFSPEQIDEIRRTCAEGHIKIIPLVQSIGHAYSVLRHSEYAGLRELPDTSQQFCLTNPEVPDFFMDLASEVLEAFPETEYFHIGGDEARRLAQCPACRQKYKDSGMGRLYGDYVNGIAEQLLQRGVTPVIWGDIIEHYPDILAVLNPDIVIAYWNYDIVNRHLDYRMEEFIDEGRKAIGCSAAKFGRQSDYLYFYRKSARNISIMNGECIRTGSLGSIMTDWMKISPPEVSLPSIAVQADTSWSGPRRQSESVNAFTRLFFGTELPELDSVLKAVSDLPSFPHEVPECEETLPYNESNEVLVDLLDRFDFKPHNFARRLGTRISQKDAAAAADILGDEITILKRLSPVLEDYKKTVLYNHRYFDIFRLALRTRLLKCRIGAALQKAVSCLKFPRPGDDGVRVKLAEELDGRETEWLQLKEESGKLLAEGSFAESVKNALRYKFDEEELHYVREYSRILRSGDILQGSISLELF